MSSSNKKKGRKVIYPERHYEIGRKVGPNEAKKLLEHMDPENRALRFTHIARLAEKMKEGLWAANGEVIKIDKYGMVVDGQHRLLAIIRSGVTVELDICYGLESDAVYTMDEGAPRQLRDKISREFPDLKAKKIHREVAEIYTKVIDYDATDAEGYKAWGRRNRGAWNYPEVFAWIRANQSTLESIIARCKTEEGKGFMRPLSAMGALYFVCKRVDSKKADAFFETMIEATSYPKGKEDPAYWCRKEIEALHARRNKEKGSDLARWPYMTVVCKAFNAWLRGERIHSASELRVTRSNPFEKVTKP